MSRRNTKFGIFNFGFIHNGGTFIDELNEWLNETEQFAEYDRFNKHFFSHVTQNGNITFLTKYGYPKDRQGNQIVESQANYAFYDTGFKSKEGNEIFGVFSRKSLARNFEGIEFADKERLSQIIETMVREDFENYP